MFGAKKTFLIFLIITLVAHISFAELSLQELETQDVDSRNYKYEKLKEHFPNKYKPIPFK